MEAEAFLFMGYIEGEGQNQTVRLGCAPRAFVETVSLRPSEPDSLVAMLGS
jgi:hypothetical protein